MLSRDSSASISHDFPGADRSFTYGQSYGDDTDTRTTSAVIRTPRETLMSGTAGRAVVELITTGRATARYLWTHLFPEHLP